jgi:hypothetical protein
MANVTKSPNSAPTTDSRSTSGSDILPLDTATAAAAPTTAPVGTIGTIEPISTPPKSAE